MTEHQNKPFGIFFLLQIDGKHPTIVEGKEPYSSLLIHISNKMATFAAVGNVHDNGS